MLSLHRYSAQVYKDHQSPQQLTRCQANRGSQQHTSDWLETQKSRTLPERFLLKQQGWRKDEDLSQSGCPKKKSRLELINCGCHFSHAAIAHTTPKAIRTNAMTLARHSVTLVFPVFVISGPDTGGKVSRLIECLLSSISRTLCGR